MKRRTFLVGGLVFAGGCTSMAVRSQSPENELDLELASTRLVGDVSVAFGTDPIAIEAIGLINGLPGTGSDPAPSPQRAALLAEMQTRGVQNPNAILASPATELVMVRGFLRPGIQKGDHFDIEVRVPGKSECTSLRDGWLMEVRLREMALLDGQFREGDTMALAQGSVLVDPSAKPDDRVAQCRGRVLAGGVAMSSRELGLVIKPDDRSVMISSQIGNAVNHRFHTYEQGIKAGVAKPKTDEFITLKVHPRYKDNIDRYIRVVRALPLRETPQEQQSRLQLLERQLLDPITSSSAALKLEAIGKDAVAILKKGLTSPDQEVRFYAAEALAYLDDNSAAETLGVLARDVPAFRAYAMTALSAMDDYAAYDALYELLKVPSAETRYGAFRALWAMNPRDQLTRGEPMGDFSYHVIDVGGPPLVHCTRSYRAEVLLFGSDQRLKLPLSIEASKKIILTGHDPASDRITISRFALDEPDQQRVVSTKLDDVIRTIHELGGHYPDVVQMLQQAKSSGALESRFEVDAIPKGGRVYYRTEAEDDSLTEDTPEIVVGNPLPDLFGRRSSDDERAAKSTNSSDSSEENDADEANSKGPVRSFFGKIWKRDRPS